jgi:hypothetical protein
MQRNGKLFCKNFLESTKNYHLCVVICIGKKKVKISLLQAVEAPRVARGRGYHIT